MPRQNTLRQMKTSCLNWLALVLQCSLIGADPLWGDVCTDDSVRSLPFCDTSLGLEDRVTDYVHRIPTKHQISMMKHGADGYEPLKIPSYQWWSEGLHGPLEPCVKFQEKCACPTSFPCPSGLGNAFNNSLYHHIGAAVGKEARSISNLRPRDAAHPGDGLTYWSPTINLQRDPRWGRNQEVPGEDPYLTSQYSIEFVKGLQGTGDKAQIGAACKHFIANSLEGGTGSGIDRHNFDARISLEDLHDYYLPPFEACARHAMGTMCSYNALNGIPTCANDWLLKDLLRKEWKFSGYVVSDCGALHDIYNGHHYANDAAQASALAINATVDLNCGNGDVYPAGLLEAFDKGLVQEETIRASFARLARIQFRLGLFDPKDFDPGHDINVVGSHGDLAFEAALQSIVLLQNRNNILPLDPNSKFAVIGPHINSTVELLSNYHGQKCGCGSSMNFSCITTPLQALSAMANSPVTGIMGCHVANDDLNEIEEATRAAKESDAVILLVGLDQSQESEGKDRTQITLPGLQTDLIQAVLQVVSDKTILVLVHGGSVSFEESILARTPAVISASYGGEAASEALASVLFGKYNPTGKLSSTMYPPSFEKDLPITEMGVRVGVGRTHLYYKGAPEFPFGHGLSYSQWELDWLDSQEGQLYLELTEESPVIRVSITIRNTGPYTGGQTVLLFWRPTWSSATVYQKLIGFQGTQDLAVNEKKTIEFDVSTDAFSMWNSRSNSTEILSGNYVLEARASGASTTRPLLVKRASSRLQRIAQLARMSQYVRP